MASPHLGMTPAAECVREACSHWASIWVSVGMILRIWAGGSGFSVCMYHHQKIALIRRVSRIPRWSRNS